MNTTNWRTGEVVPAAPPPQQQQQAPPPATFKAKGRRPPTAEAVGGWRAEQPRTPPPTAAAGLSPLSSPSASPVTPGTAAKPAVFKARGGGWRNGPDPMKPTSPTPSSSSSPPQPRPQHQQQQQQGFGGGKPGKAGGGQFEKPPPMVRRGWVPPSLFLQPVPPDAPPAAAGEGKEYQSRKFKLKTAVHWGQRKLLLSELQFLLSVKNAPQPFTVLYVGSAPGIHLPWVAQKFRAIVKKWILIDPADFDVRCREFESVEAINNYFTDATAWLVRRKVTPYKGLALLTEVAAGANTLEAKFIRVATGRVPNLRKAEMSAGGERRNTTCALDAIMAEEAQRHPILFISDIRTGDRKTDGAVEFEKGVQRNMEDQMRWHLILQPESSMLKFRLPYMTIEDTQGNKIEHSERCTEYLEGDIQLQIWAPLTSTETRLVVNRGAGLVLYDNKRYEDEMYYQNTVVRECHHFNHNVKAPGLDHRWDARAEIDVLTEYVKWANPDLEDEGLISSAVARLSEEISRTLDKSFDAVIRHGETRYMQSVTKKGWADEGRGMIVQCRKERGRPAWWTNEIGDEERGGGGGGGGGTRPHQKGGKKK